jgi:hypothetical protein
MSQGEAGALDPAADRLLAGVRTRLNATIEVIGDCSGAVVGHVAPGGVLQTATKDEN